MTFFIYLLREYISFARVYIFSSPYFYIFFPAQFRFRRFRAILSWVLGRSDSARWWHLSEP